MAITNSLHHPHHHFHHHHNHNNHNSLFKPNSLFLKPTASSTSYSTTTLSHAALSSIASASAATASSSSTTEPVITFDLLAHHLSTQNFRQADEETRRLLIFLAGEAAQERGYVFFSEVQFISDSDIKAIDNLWRTHSNNRFGYSVQRRIWKKVNKDFSNFFLKIGWMKKLDTEVEQYNYRAFPDEFTWELKDDTPEGHLPLTNALRGTQLLNSILSRPAFEAMDDQEEDIRTDGNKAGERESSGSVNGGVVKQSPPLSKRVLKPDYSF